MGMLPQTLRGKIRIVCLIPLLTLMALSFRYTRTKLKDVVRMDRLSGRIGLQLEAAKLDQLRIPYLIDREVARQTKQPLPPEPPGLAEAIAAFQEGCRRQNNSIFAKKPYQRYFEYPGLRLDASPLSLRHLHASKNDRLLFGNRDLNHWVLSDILYLGRSLEVLLFCEAQLAERDPEGHCGNLSNVVRKAVSTETLLIKRRSNRIHGSILAAEKSVRAAPTQKHPSRIRLMAVRQVTKEQAPKVERRIRELHTKHMVKLTMAGAIFLFIPLLTWLFLRRIDRAIITPLRGLHHAANHIGSGRTIDADAVSGPTEFVEIGEALVATQNNIATLQAELAGLAEAVRAGRLDARGTPEDFQGAWAELVRGMNDTLAEAERLKTQAEGETEERSKTERMLYQSQKQELIGRLAGGLAHDFNNYLTIIRGSSELLLNKAESPDASAGLEDILTAACNASDLVRRLLMIAEPQMLHPEALSIMGQLSRIQKLIRLGLKDHVRLDIIAPPENARIHMDPGAFEQIMLNLSINAGHAMPDGGLLTIDSAFVSIDQSVAVAKQVQPGDFWRIRVIDTGVGIDENMREHVFEAFFSTRSAMEGTGLGLTMVRALVRQSGGWVELDSTLGHGTTISLFIPATERLAEPERSLPSDFTCGNGTILLVEDRAGVRKFTRKILKRFGYDVIEAVDGDHGVAQYKAHRDEIGLIMTDVLMPKLNGPEMVRRIRKHAERTCPVIFVSGHTDHQLQENFDEELTRCSFMDKPFDLKLLSIKISEEIEKTVD